MFFIFNECAHEQLTAVSNKHETYVMNTQCDTLFSTAHLDKQTNFLTELSLKT